MLIFNPFPRTTAIPSVTTSVTFDTSESESSLDSDDAHETPSPPESGEYTSSGSIQHHRIRKRHGNAEGGPGPRAERHRDLQEDSPCLPFDERRFQLDNSADATPVKRGPGRPPGSRNREKPVAQDGKPKNSVGRPRIRPKKPTPPPGAPRRPRGRPRKNSVSVAMSETPVPGGTEEDADHTNEDGAHGHESEAEPQCPQTPSGSRMPQTSPGLDHNRRCNRDNTQAPTNFEEGQEEADMEQHTMTRTARIRSSRPARQEDVRRCIDRIKNDVPTVTLDDDTLLRLLQTRVPGSVTNDKEVMGMVQAEWEASGECLAMRIAPDIRTETRDAWRIGVHLLRCSPIAIISPAWGLYYDNDNRETCLWSRRFSSTLGMIMIHPIWNEDKHSLIRAIQVAVTCRTEEHRPFRMPGGESAIVNCLAREVAHNTNGRSMAEICNSLRRAHGTARTRMTTTTEFAFIKHLAATVSVSSQDLSDALGDDVRLRVQEQDLENIVKAINTFTPFGPPCTPPAAIYQGYLASHDSQPDLGVARIRELYTQSWLIELREKWRHEQEPGHRQSQVLDEPRLIQHGQGHPRAQSGQDSVALSRPTYQALTLPSSRRPAPAANDSQPPKPLSGSIPRSEGVPTWPSTVGSNHGVSPGGSATAADRPRPPPRGPREWREQCAINRRGQAGAGRRYSQPQERSKKRKYNSHLEGERH